MSGEQDLPVEVGFVDERGRLTSEQRQFLMRPLNGARVQIAQGQAHLAAWDVRRYLLRVFGWGGWEYDVVECSLVAERESMSQPRPGREPRPVYTVVYRVLMRLTLRDEHGREIAHFEDGATGDAVNQPNLGDAHDMALKTALSQALKRCAMNLGDQFGLGLYNRARGVEPTLDPVVGWSLPNRDEPTTDDAPVAAGDDDGHVEPQDEPTSPTMPQDVTGAPDDVGTQDDATGAPQAPPGDEPWPDPNLPPTDEVPREVLEARAKSDAAQTLANRARARRTVETLASVYEEARTAGLLKVMVRTHDEGHAPLHAVIHARKVELMQRTEGS